jgi:hypothetical protein
LRNALIHSRVASDSSGAEAILEATDIKKSLFPASPKNDLDVSKEEGAVTFRPPHNWWETSIHKKQHHYFTITTLSYIGQGIIQTIVLHLLYFL